MPRVQEGAHQLNASRSATAMTAACCSSLSGAKLARSPWDGKQACHRPVRSYMLQLDACLHRIAAEQANTAHHGVCKLPLHADIGGPKEDSSPLTRVLVPCCATTHSGRLDSAGQAHLRLQLVAGPLGHAAKVVSGQQVHMRQARLRQHIQVAAPCKLRP